MRPPCWKRTTSESKTRRNSSSIPTISICTCCPGASAIDAGSPLNAPELDRERIARPQGDGIDIGAYEWHTDDVLPVEPNSVDL